MRSAWVTSSGVALHLSIAESARPGPAVVFVHGMTANAFFYSRMIPGADFLGAVSPLRGAGGAAPGLGVPAAAVFRYAGVFEDPANERIWRRARRMTWWYTLASIVSLYGTPEDKPAIEAMSKPALIATGEED